MPKCTGGISSEPKPYPLALAPMNPVKMLEWLIYRHDSRQSTIIICCEREGFLESLILHIRENDEEDTTDVGRNLLTPTLFLIASSQHIRLVFTPTISHLRAYLARLIWDQSQLATKTESRSRKPFLILWGFVALHRSTFEYSAQGISRTLAAAIEAGHFQSQRLLLVEDRGLDSHEGVEDSDRQQFDPWREQVPLLNGSVRFGGEEKGWAGRMIELRDVIRKWCRFGTLERLEDVLQGSKRAEKQIRG